MLRLLQRLSGFAFYILGLSFFVAYVLLKNELGGKWPAWWMQVADLPFALTTILFGGISFYLSVRRPDTGSKFLAAFIAVPLFALFAGLSVLKFLPLLGK